MSYLAALEELYRLTPKGIHLGLDRVRSAAERLGHPERHLRCIQVAGTNGKGTVSTLLAHALTLSGLRVGLYTSPHLHRFAERIRIDGQEAAPKILLDHLRAALALTHGENALPLTFFEIATLTAFSFFNVSEVNVAVLEVGLGGRLDATSVTEPELTAVTSIGRDHTALLGDRLEQIALEKAAIARPGVPLVVGDLTKEALEATLALADRIQAPCRILGRDFELPGDLIGPWPGKHQQDNAAIAFELYRLFLKGDSRFDEHHFRRALDTVRLPGRFETLDRRPRYILDSAHNLEAVQALASSLRLKGEHPETLIFGVLTDKPAKEMMSTLLPLVKHIILTKPPIDRALDPRVLASTDSMICPRIDDAIAVAEKTAGPEGTVLVTGSIFTVGAVRGRLLGEPSDPPIGL